MSDYSPSPPKSIEEAARGLVNAIADMVHSTLAARDAAEKARMTTPSEPEDPNLLRTAEYRAEDRAADEEKARADEALARVKEEAEEYAAQEAADREALAAVDRRVVVGERVGFVCSGSGRTTGPNPLQMSNFQIRSKITFPDSLRTAVATIFREEPAVDELYNIVLDGDNDVTYRARRDRDEPRQIRLEGSRLREPIIMSVDDLAEAEVPM